MNDIDRIIDFIFGFAVGMIIFCTLCSYIIGQIS